MAVGVASGGACAGLVAAFTRDRLMPLVAALIGRPDVSALRFAFGGSRFACGDFLKPW
jgi:large-conductance mechanosensitive channel